MGTAVEDFIAGLPKAELHVHLEGSLEPEMLLGLARRNRVQIPFESVDAVREAYQFADLQSFLDAFYQGPVSCSASGTSSISRRPTWRR